MHESSRYAVPPEHCLHPRYADDVLRANEAEAVLSTGDLVYPLFVTEGVSAPEPIQAMPGQCRWPVEDLADAVAPLCDRGLKSIIVFGVPVAGKDGRGTRADAEDTPAIRAVRALREALPGLEIITDVCLCAYTDHGHCGILNPDGTVDNPASVARLAEVATAYARAGAHVVAPSDMMDGRVGAIRQALDGYGLGRVEVLSYAAKFASAFYGPFRDAAKSAPSFGDRHAYQLPPAARRLALDAVARDVAEGAAAVMVKPAGPYLDIVRDVKERVAVPVACYQVSGEFAMLHHAAAAGAFDLRTTVLEALTGMRRAGADRILTYFAPQALEWLEEGKGIET